MPIPLRQYRGLTPVTVKSGQTFQGRLHFCDVDYHVSPEWAKHLIAEGIAVPKAGPTLEEANHGQPGTKPWGKAASRG